MQPRHGDLLHDMWQEWSEGLCKTVTDLVASWESRAPGFVGHSDRVALYTVELALVSGMPAAEINLLALGAYFHDIGKIYIPTSILASCGPLTPYESAIIKRHPDLGVMLLQSHLSPHTAPCILDAVRYHHERLDGRGYPSGLVGQYIPLWGRMCAIADSWDAMLSPRPYRSALGVNLALEELTRGRGSHFDPDLIDLFIDRVVPRFK